MEKQKSWEWERQLMLQREEGSEPDLNSLSQKSGMCNAQIIFYNFLVQFVT